jgi:hypothetical protein
MFWHPSGAPVPLELIWSSGFGVNGMALIAATVCTILVGLAFRGVHRRAARSLQALTPAKRTTLARQAV